MSKKQSYYFFSVFVFGASTALSAPSGFELMKKQEASQRLSDYEAKVTLTQTNLDTQKIKKKVFRFWRKLKAGSNRYQTLTRFLEPGEIRNEGVLLVENDSGKNDVQLYLPAYKKVRRVEAQSQQGSFMGSDFSYSDITSPHPEDFSYGEVTEKPCLELLTENCFYFTARPKDQELRERTGYQEIQLYLEKKNFVAVAAEYQGLDGQWFKSLRSSDIRVVDPIENKVLAHRITLTQKGKASQTILLFEQVKVKQGIQDGIFTQSHLQTFR